MSETGLTADAAVEHFRRLFEARTEGRPYTVERVEDGLLLRLDVQDLAWRTFLHAQGISTDYRIMLRFDTANRTYTREQQIHDMRWRAGAGAGGVGAEFVQRTARGTFVTKEYRRYTAVGPGGTGTVEYRFDSTEMTALVAEVMDGTGWTRKTDPGTRLGLVIAGSVLGGIVLAGLVVLAVLLL
ncbi:hypothetical protein [Actinacidiphila yeochonensis]|uniref:hypothetical protein n=1 Tax=Actinacidiphila yeochonensis TaxID=89050 RepID=UPI00056AE74A|nr:hypothetical protein [Actinacidiphila yeochonensis]